MERILAFNGCLIDEEDLPKLIRYNWKVERHEKTSYMVFKYFNKYRQIKRIYMHRVILDLRGRQDADHIDGIGLNNIKINLKPKSHSENMKNTHKPSNSMECFVEKYLMAQSGASREEIFAFEEDFMKNRYVTGKEYELICLKESMRKDGIPEEEIEKYFKEGNDL